MSKKQRKQNKVGFTAGAWDLCHAGHMLTFKECKKVCDYLVVALHSDPSTAPKSYRGKKKNPPIMTVEERYEILSGVKYIDSIVVYDTEDDLYDLLTTLKIDIRIVGADWKWKEYTGYKLPIEVHFNERNHNYSSTELRKRIYEAENKRHNDDN